MGQSRTKVGNGQRGFAATFFPEREASPPFRETGSKAGRELDLRGKGAGRRSDGKEKRKRNWKKERERHICMDSGGSGRLTCSA